MGACGLQCSTLLLLFHRSSPLNMNMPRMSCLTATHLPLVLLQAEHNVRVVHTGHLGAVQVWQWGCCLPQAAKEEQDGPKGVCGLTNRIFI